MKWQLLHGRSFVFSGATWAQVMNTFSSGYAIGYHFIKSQNGVSSNGHFVGIGELSI